MILRLSGFSRTSIKGGITNPIPSQQKFLSFSKEKHIWYHAYALHMRREWVWKDERRKIYLISCICISYAPMVMQRRWLFGGSWFLSGGTAMRRGGRRLIRGIRERGIAAAAQVWGRKGRELRESMRSFILD